MATVELLRPARARAPRACCCRMGTGRFRREKKSQGERLTERGRDRFDDVLSPPLVFGTTDIARQRETERGVPCFVLWCMCFFCSNIYGRRDLALVQEQRIQRAAEATKRKRLETAGPFIRTDDSLGDPGIAAAAAAAGDYALDPQSGRPWVDLGHVLTKDWDLVLSA